MNYAWSSVKCETQVEKQKRNAYYFSVPFSNPSIRKLHLVLQNNTSVNILNLSHTAYKNNKKKFQNFPMATKEKAICTIQIRMVTKM